MSKHRNISTMPKEYDLYQYEPLKVCPDYRINVYKGTVINRYDRLLKKENPHRKYDAVCIKGKTYNLGRLVYRQHHGNIPKGMVIDHIDDNPKNNRIYNLQLLTQSDNVKKSMKNRDHTYLKNNHSVSRKRNIKATCLATNTSTIYPSLYQCQKDLHINSGIVKMVCEGKNKCKTGTSKKDHNKYTFEYTQAPVQDTSKHRCQCGGFHKNTPQGRHTHKKTKLHQQWMTNQ